MVLVSHTHKFIFLKTRKTASTSVEMLLEPLCAPPNHVVTEGTEALETDHGIIGTRLVPPGKRNALSRRWYNHMTAPEISSALGPERFNDYLKITTVRNPFDRLVSEFMYKNARRKRRPIGALIDRLVRKPSGKDANIRKFRKWLRRGRWKSDYDILHVGGRFVPDILIRFENLAADLRTLSDRLGVNLHADMLPVTKPGPAPGKRTAPHEFFGPREVGFLRTNESWIFKETDYPDHPTEYEVSP